ncbi:hypothetical protein METHB2_790004 [Candidatus Methylobacter favarea]|uniref:Uncharacterized protein n=1 Tax=Candidatus Methylobacter favarea TaxID=2707345 RepID=A0A8S0WLJ9_9GAMM|nr:hypothetical protein [Candidatus Methylobacter favarea]CAA9892670.1 hypothetical protein METHB2_790004 [Candidatus Methylobacter favarea]
MGDLLYESELLKERQKAIAEIKASRTLAKKTVGGIDRPMSARELLNNPIVDLLARQNPKDDEERHFLLHTWLNPLKDATTILSSMWNKLCEGENKKERVITSSDRQQYEEALYLISCKEDEIYLLLSDSPPVENTALETPKSVTEAVRDDIVSHAPKLTTSDGAGSQADAEITDTSLMEGSLKTLDRTMDDRLACRVLPDDFIAWTKAKGYSVPAESGRIESIPENEAVENDGAATGIEQQKGDQRQGEQRNTHAPSQLHVFFWRVHQSFSGKRPTAQDVWNEIKSNYKKHDTDEIIQEVTARKILWCSAYGNEQTFSRGTFDKTLSNLRKNPPILKK